MKKLINTKPFTFFIDVEIKKEIDEYLLEEPYGFSAFIRLIVKKETIKYMPYIGMQEKRNKFHVLDKLDKEKEYKRVSANIEEIDLIVLDYLARKNHVTIGSIIRNLINNKLKNIRGDL